MTPHGARRPLRLPRRGTPDALAPAAWGSCTHLVPFGLAVTPREETALASLVASGPWRVEAWVRTHRVVLLRGFAPLDEARLVAFCRALGQVQDWAEGPVRELAARGEGPVLFTARAVPMHWDFAWTGGGGVHEDPRYLVFHCDVAPPPGAGGETLFADTTRVLARATRAERTEWTAARPRYATGTGAFTAPLVSLHPFTAEPVLRTIEAPEAHELSGGPPDLRRHLYDPAVCYAHRWRDGDVVVADNHALLHARAPFDARAERRIRRVNVV